jgi:hypothetical protein
VMVLRSEFRSGLTEEAGMSCCIQEPDGVFSMFSWSVNKRRSVFAGDRSCINECSSSCPEFLRVSVSVGCLSLGVGGRSIFEQPQDNAVLKAIPASQQSGPDWMF